MTLYTNCEKMHCSMKLEDDALKNSASEIATHLTVTRYRKYPIIAQDLNICVDVCRFSKKCKENEKTKPLKIEE